MKISPSKKLSDSEITERFIELSRQAKKNLRKLLELMRKGREGNGDGKPFGTTA